MWGSSVKCVRTGGGVGGYKKANTCIQKGVRISIKAYILCVPIFFNNYDIVILLLICFEYLCFCSSFSRQHSRTCILIIAFHLVILIFWKIILISSELLQKCIAYACTWLEGWYRGRWGSKKWCFMLTYFMDAPVYCWESVMQKPPSRNSMNRKLAFFDHQSAIFWACIIN